MRIPIQASPVDRRGNSAAFSGRVSPSDFPCGNVSCPDGTCCQYIVSGGGDPYFQCGNCCFPARATVRDKAGRVRAMKDLAIGDQVQVVLPDGSLGFEDIYLFTHKDSQEITRYLRINLESGKSLMLSPRHFVPVKGCCSETWADHTFKAADEIKVGELIWNCTETGVIGPATVATIEEVKEAGVFNPLTFSGTIVVDGVAASTHSDWFLDGLVSVPVQTRVYQALFAPVRLIYRLIGPAWTRRIAEDWGVVDFLREKTERPAQRLA